MAGGHSGSRWAVVCLCSLSFAARVLPFLARLVCNPCLRNTPVHYVVVGVAGAPRNPLWTSCSTHPHSVVVRWAPMPHLDARGGVAPCLDRRDEGRLQRPAPQVVVGVVLAALVSAVGHRVVRPHLGMKQ